MKPQHVRDLTPDPQNARRHNPRNVGMIETSLREVGAGRSIVIDENNVILAGNATVEAAASAGIERVLTVDVDGETIVAVRRSNLTPAQKARLGLFDNRTAELAEWDESVLAELAAEGVGLEDLFREAELAEIIGDVSAPDEDAYSRAVESPVYTITGERPAVSELLDSGRTEELLVGIANADVPNDVATFLRAAAYRHAVFDYAKIAEFYAHADAGTQDLMEQSALIILDYERAIELGFARLVEELRDIAAQDEDEDEDNE